MLWYVNYPESETLLIPMYNEDFSYPAHLHGCFEISFCMSGLVDVILDGESYPVPAGQGILIPPNTVHGYHTPDTSKYYTILFSKDLLPDFSGMFTRKVPKNYIFTVDGPLCQQLSEFYASSRTLFGGKSLLYRAAEVFLQDNAFLDADNTGDDLTKLILSYIQDNLDSEIHLQDLANHLGYSYFYISKRIRQVFAMSFTDLLSQYRVAKAKMLLDSGKYTVSQTVLSCGFGSIRTFNRAFLRLTGMTPTAYRERTPGNPDSHF